MPRLGNRSPRAGTPISPSKSPSAGLANEFGGPAHQSGRDVTITLEPDGLYHVTDLQMYAST